MPYRTSIHINSYIYVAKIRSQRYDTASPCSQSGDRAEKGLGGSLSRREALNNRCTPPVLPNAYLALNEPHPPPRPPPAPPGSDREIFSLAPLGTPRGHWPLTHCRGACARSPHLIHGLVALVLQMEGARARASVPV